KHGRINIPSPLRTYTKLDKECVVIGVSNRIEVWAKEIWEDYIQEPEESFADIAENLRDLDIQKQVDDMSDSIHNSVLKNEAIKALNVKENGIYVDGTLGRAGHAREIAKQLHSDGLLIGFDQDKAAIEAAKSVLPDKSLLIHDNFIHLNKVLE